MGDQQSNVLIKSIRLFINFSGYNIGDLVDFDLKTPLLVAASKGHFNAVRELLVYNPGVIDIPDNKGMTPLMYSCKSSRIGMSNISKFLLNKGANYTRTANDGYKIPIRYINYLIPNFVHIMIDGKIVKSGNMELVNYLEEKGYEELNI